MTAIVQAGANQPLSFVVGDDVSLRLTVTENSVAYSWTGATVTTSIIANGAAVATNFTTTTSTGGILDLSLTDTETTTLGLGTFDYWVKVTVGGVTSTWVAGQLTMHAAQYGSASNLSSSLSITTAPSTTLAITLSGYPGTAGRGIRVVFLGDSITCAQGGDILPRAYGLSYPTFAHYASYGRLLRLSNAGVSGNTSADMLARFDTDVTPFSPSAVAIMAGTNDFNDSSTTTLAQYAANITAIVAKCKSISAAPILCTIPPNVLSTTRRGRTTTGNAWLRDYAAKNGIPLVDFYNLLVDPATGDFLSAYGSALSDQTHPTNPGYVAMGQYFWTQLSTWFPPIDCLLPMENADPKNLLTNGLNLTTTGSGTSLMPTGWTVQSSVHPTGVTGSLVTGDTTIKGNWWRVAGNGTTAAATNNEFQTVSGIIPGHTYAHVGRFRATGMRGADSGSGSQWLIGNAYNSVLNSALYDFRAAASHSYNQATGIFYQESVAPSDASTCLVRRQLLNTTAGAGTLDIAQTGFYDLTEMGLR